APGPSVPKSTKYLGNRRFVHCVPHGVPASTSDGYIRMVVLWSTLGQAPARADRGSEPSTPVRAARRRPDASQNGLVTAHQRDRLEVTPTLADHVPAAAELVPVLAVRLPGLLVAGVAVQ